MMARWLPLILFALVFTPGLLRAQTRRVEAIVYLTEANNGKMYEDIEIFRRILDRKLQGINRQGEGSASEAYNLIPYFTALPNDPTAYFLLNQVAPPGTWVDISAPVKSNQLSNRLMPLNYKTYSPQTYYYQSVTNPEPRAAIEGVYLKGQGIVYTATLPSLQLTSKAEATKPISEWESVRRQLHNEKEGTQKPEAKKPPSVSDVLLKVLAENGHHFSQLGENESLMIVLTVHDASPSSTATKSTGGSAKTESKPVYGGSYSSSVSPKVRDLELLGDLHMRQEHFGMARDAFREALEFKPARKLGAKLARKLAQAYLMLNEIEKARGALDQALALTKESTDAKAKPTPATKPVPALPIKLIISAPKKLLDEVKDGKLSFEEFRRRASVETLRFGDRR